MVPRARYLFMALCLLCIVGIEYTIWHQTSLYGLLKILLKNNTANSDARSPKLYLHDVFPNDSFPPFQPEVFEDFPTVYNTTIIPHILHQTYKDYMISNSLVPHIRRLREQHPNWKYYFWTDESARRLVESHYQWLLPTWNTYKLGINKGDALRYIVLYHFGGVYLDLDTDTLRPLDRATTKYSCIIASEPFEHSVFLFNTTTYLTNAIMFSRPKHPFRKLVMNMLLASAKHTDVLESAGPGLLTRAYYAYNNIDVNDINRTTSNSDSNSPFFYKGELPETHENAVYIPNTQYFNDDVDVSLQKSRIENICNDNNFPTQTYLFKRACVDMKRRGIVRKKISEFKFVKHTWNHIWLQSEGQLNKTQKEDVRTVIKDFIIYGENGEI